MANKKSKAKKVKTEVQETKPTTTAKAAKPTRAEVFHQIMKSGGGTRKEIADKMIALYGGSEVEAEFQTVSFLRLLTTMGYATKKDDGTYALAK